MTHVPLRTTLIDNIFLSKGTYEYIAAGHIENSAYGVSFKIKNMDDGTSIVSRSATNVGGVVWHSTFILEADTNVKISSYNMNGTFATAVFRIE